MWSIQRYSRRDGDRCAAGGVTKSNLFSYLKMSKSELAALSIYRPWLTATFHSLDQMLVSQDHRAYRVSHLHSEASCDSSDHMHCARMSRPSFVDAESFKPLN